MKAFLRRWKYQVRAWRLGRILVWEGYWSAYLFALRRNWLDRVDWGDPGERPMFYLKESGRWPW